MYLKDFYLYDKHEYGKILTFLHRPTDNTHLYLKTGCWVKCTF